MCEKGWASEVLYRVGQLVSWWIGEPRGQSRYRKRTGSIHQPFEKVRHGVSLLLAEVSGKGDYRDDPGIHFVARLAVCLMIVESCAF